jgi:hypothetical protein
MTSQESVAGIIFGMGLFAPDGGFHAMESPGWAAWT